MTKRILSVLLALCIITFVGIQSFAVTCSESGTGVAKYIYAAGQYSNWDGVTNVAQFKGDNGGMYFAVDGDSSVTVYKTKNGKLVSGTVTLKKQYPIFGTVTCDAGGNFYLITGKKISNTNSSENTVFISKYDKNGNHIKTVGDNGSSSLGFSGDNSWLNQEPFHGGCCDAVVSGDYLSVNYARLMNSGHQCNSVLTVNINTFAKVNVGSIYSGHSFAQRVVALPDGFSYMSEGDCYNRAFTSNSIKLSNNKVTKSNQGDVFNFWVKKGTLDEYNMYVLNDNFATMGGITPLSDGRIAFASQSAKSLNSNAANETQEIFIQIFDPFKNLETADAYTTSGTRSGMGGGNGDISVSDYGVKWLTSYGKTHKVTDVQTVSTDDDKIVVLYELHSYWDYAFEGIHYFLLNSKGEVLVQSQFLDKNARLNPCEMPVFADGKVCWVGNNNSDSNYGIFIYTLDPYAYPDVPKNAWFYDAVMYCTDKGFMTGYKNGKFGSGDALQRQDFVVTLARIAGADLDSYKNMTSSMPDVVKGSYYAAAVNWAVDKGIITGYDNGKFGVGDKINREQVATILYRYMGSPEIDGIQETLCKFSDSDKISEFAKDALAWANQNGIINGKTDVKLAPTATASRAEIATIIMRMDKAGMFEKG
jgi:hypothetical protein